MGTVLRADTCNYEHAKLFFDTYLYLAYRKMKTFETTARSNTNNIGYVASYSYYKYAPQHVSW